MEEDARGGLSDGDSRSIRGDDLPVHKATFPSFAEQPNGGTLHPIDLLRDVEVELTAELGSTRMQIKHILGLRPGSVIELDRLAGEPVDLTINKTLIARGEVVVVDEKFAIRIVEIVSPEKRLASSGGA